MIVLIWSYMCLSSQSNCTQLQHHRAGGNLDISNVFVDELLEDICCSSWARQTNANNLAIGQVPLHPEAVLVPPCSLAAATAAWRHVQNRSEWALKDLKKLCVCVRVFSMVYSELVSQFYVIFFQCHLWNGWIHSGQESRAFKESNTNYCWLMMCFHFLLFVPFFSTFVSLDGSWLVW